MAELQRRCQDAIALTDDEPDQAVSIYITCQMLLVTAKGTKVSHIHIHHHRDLDIPGCEDARVSWTRRR